MGYVEFGVPELFNGFQTISICHSLVYSAWMPGVTLVYVDEYVCKDFRAAQHMQP